MTRFDGYLFSKLQMIGTRSEGPAYYIQQWNYMELPIIKKAKLHKTDPKLHSHIGQRVSITGKMTD